MLSALSVVDSIVLLVSYFHITYVVSLPISLDSVLLTIATIFIALATVFVYRATDRLYRSQVKPLLNAYPRPVESGDLGIIVESIGNGIVLDAVITCKTESGSAYYTFPRLPVMGVYEFPKYENQQKIPLSDTDSQLTIDLSYKDIDGNPYSRSFSFPLEEWRVARKKYLDSLPKNKGFN